MGTGLLIAGIVAAIASVVGSVWSNVREQKNYNDAMEYNLPVNQIQRLEEAGLNPNLAAGSPNTVSVSQPSVTNPAESLIGGVQNIANMYASSQGLDIRRDSNQIRKSQMELSLIKLNLTEKLVKQQLDKGNVDLALKLLNYDTLAATQPAVIDKALADAGLAVNRRNMSDIDLLSYESYVDNKLAMQESSIAKSDAETFYLQNVKPKLEWERISLTRQNAEELARHNKEVEQIQKDAAKMTQKERDRQYNLAVRRYKLAVRAQKWEEAHYWYNLAAGTLASGVKTISWMNGIPIK